MMILEKQHALSAVIDKAPPVPHPGFKTPEPPPEIGQLIIASATGDLAAAQAIFSQWRAKPITDRIEKRRFVVALAAAVNNQHVPVISYLLAQGVPLNIGMFVCATKLKSIAMLQLFLDHGWDINEPIDRITPPPLMLLLDDENLLRWFLARGANPDAECGFDCTPLSIAVSRASFPIIKFLFDSGGTVQHGQLLHYAVKREASDRLEVINFLLNKGIFINHIMYQNRWNDYYQQRAFGLGTALHRAAEMGNLDVVELLLRRGADPLIRDARGKLAVERAEYNEHIKVAELLRPFSAPDVPLHDFLRGRRIGVA